MSAPFYITTPIYYPNGEPHLGHAYTTLAADAVARYHRLAGHDTFLLTGADEHGVKMVKTAAEKGISPQALADQNVAVFENLWKELDVTNDDFIRTSSPRHKVAVQAIVDKLLSNGDIYLGAYEGWYDEGQEEFVTETAAKDQDYKSAISKRPLVRYSEPTYFFKLKKYVPLVQKYIEDHPHFIQPDSRRNEVLSKLKQGVEDLSISRASLTWGIEMPNDPKHVLYVWIDALSNYITALGFPVADVAKFQRYWPADVHLIGKEILWFHTVYWPAMLMSLELPLPERVFAHGWWTSAGQKMSKTLGNFIDVEKLRSIISIYGLDALRDHLLRAAPFGNDLDWQDADFAKSHNELANVLGNCLNRTVNMIARYRGSVVPAPEHNLQDIDRNLLEKTYALSGELMGAYGRLELQQACLLPIELARLTNGYIDATAPFKLAKDPGQAPRLDTVLHVCAQAIHRALVCLIPILPHKAAEALAQLNVDIRGKTLPQLLEPLPPGHKSAKANPSSPASSPPSDEPMHPPGPERRPEDQRQHRPPPPRDPDPAIAETAGVDGVVIAQKIKESDAPNHGHNALTHEYGDLMKMGVIVPTKVDRIALQNTASIASLLLTTDAIVSEMKEDKPVAAGAGGNDMY